MVKIHPAERRQQLRKRRTNSLRIQGEKIMKLKFSIPISSFFAVKISMCIYFERDMALNVIYVATIEISAFKKQ
jgi:hypothetical protein